MSRFQAVLLASIAMIGITCASPMAFIPGDLNNDGVVDNVDLAILGQAWNSHSGDTNYTANADLNSDRAVNLLDLAILGKFWGVSEDRGCYDVEEGCENTSGMKNVTCIYGHWLCRHTPLPQDGIDWDYFNQLGVEIGLAFIKDASCTVCPLACAFLGAATGIPGLICGAACVLWCLTP